jgi:hypothetical protein
MSTKQKNIDLIEVTGIFFKQKLKERELWQQNEFLRMVKRI